MRNNILHTTLRSFIFPLRIEDTFDGAPVVGYETADEVIIRHDLSDHEQAAQAELRIKPYWHKPSKEAGLSVGPEPLMPRILCARMRCVYKGCGTFKYGDQGISDDAADGDLEDGPSESLKARRAQFRADNRNPSSSRLDALMENLIPIVEANAGKVLIFDEFLQTLDIVANALDERDVPYLRFDGWMTEDERDAVIERFQNNRDPIKIMLLTIQTGGLGHTLTAARWVFMLTMHWNPFVNLQAAARANRTGQRYKVTVFYFFSRGTVEEKVNKIRQTKLKKAKNVLGPDSISERNKKIMASWDLETFCKKVSHTAFPVATVTDELTTIVDKNSGRVTSDRD